MFQWKNLWIWRHFWLTFGFFEEFFGQNLEESIDVLRMSVALQRWPSLHVNISSATSRRTILYSDLFPRDVFQEVFKLILLNIVNFFLKKILPTFWEPKVATCEFHASTLLTPLSATRTSSTDAWKPMKLRLRRISSLEPNWLSFKHMKLLMFLRFFKFVEKNIPIQWWLHLENMYKWCWMVMFIYTDIILK